MRPPYFVIKLAAHMYVAKIKKHSTQVQKVQLKVFHKILKNYKQTELGKLFNLHKVHNVEDFNNIVGISIDTDYNELIDEVKRNNSPGRVQAERLRYLAKTSGSTAKSKYIPFTSALIKNFQRFSTNLVFHFCYINKSYDVLEQHILVSPSNPVTERSRQGIIIGYAAGIMTMLAPKFSQKIVRPTHKILKIANSQEKVSAMVEECLELDIRSFSSVPAFAIPIFETLFAAARAKGKKVETIKDIWPNFRMYMWSGAAVGPYEKRLREFLGPDIPMREIYSATESPIAFQYSEKPGELYLDLESCFYQFQEDGSPLDSKRLGVHEVEVGKHYRILITTQGGLICYRIGDLIEFTSLSPPLIKILGREKEELNMAGTERLSLPMLQEFLASVMTKYNYPLEQFFISPYSENKKTGYHWCFEVEQEEIETNTKDWNDVLQTLDTDLIAYNSGYKLSRDSDTRLRAPKLTLIPKGSIQKYILASKQFGQGKFLTVHNGQVESNKFFKFIAKENIPTSVFS